MASLVEHSIHVPEFSPEEVFDAGIQLESLPYVNGLDIEADTTNFELGTPVRVGVKVANQSFHMPTSVTEFEPAERITLFGESKRLGKVTIGLALSSSEEQEGTIVDYSVLIKHSLLTKFLEPLVKEHLKFCLPRYANKHKNNVELILNDQEVLAS